jgi:hypothetical protein
LLWLVGSIDLQSFGLALVLGRTDHGYGGFGVADDILSILLAPQCLIDLVALAVLVPAALTRGRSTRARTACATGQAGCGRGGWHLCRGSRGCGRRRTVRQTLRHRA